MYAIRPTEASHGAYMYAAMLASMKQPQTIRMSDLAGWTYTLSAKHDAETIRPQGGGNHV